MKLLAIILTILPTTVKTVLDGERIEDDKKTVNHLRGNIILFLGMIIEIPGWYLSGVDYPCAAPIFSIMFHLVFFNYMINLYRNIFKHNKYIKWHHLGNGYYDSFLKKFGGNIYGVIILQVIIAGLIYSFYYGLGYVL